ncbi:unnamed protein product, partial [Ectocarpus fasciculatus]
FQIHTYSSRCCCSAPPQECLRQPQPKTRNTRRVCVVDGYGDARIPERLQLTRSGRNSLGGFVGASDGATSAQLWPRSSGWPLFV